MDCCYYELLSCVRTLKVNITSLYVDVNIEIHFTANESSPPEFMYVIITHELLAFGVDFRDGVGVPVQRDRGFVILSR